MAANQESGCHRNLRSLGGFADRPGNRRAPTEGRATSETWTTRRSEEAPAAAPDGMRHEPSAGGPAGLQKLGRGGGDGNGRAARAEAGDAVPAPAPAAWPRGTHLHRSSRAAVQSRSARSWSGAPGEAGTTGLEGR